MIFVDFKHSIMISSLFYGCKLIRQKKGSVRPDLNSGVWNVSNLVHTTRSGITFISYAHNQKVGKPNNLIVFVSKLTKGSKEDNHNRLRSSIPEGGEP
jgi:hypothetical protein